MSETRLTCILCPNGCELDVRWNGVRPTAENLTVEGDLCPRGSTYAVEELTRPMRTVTTTLRVDGGTRPLVSVRTASPVDRSTVPRVLEVLRARVIPAPVRLGDRLVEDVAGTGVAVVATRSVDAAPS